MLASNKMPSQAAERLHPFPKPSLSVIHTLLRTLMPTAPSLTANHTQELGPPPAVFWTLQVSLLRNWSLTQNSVEAPISNGFIWLRAPSSQTFLLSVLSPELANREVIDKLFYTGSEGYRQLTGNRRQHRTKTQTAGHILSSPM